RQVVNATTGRQYAGVADQHVEPAETLDRQPHDRFHLLEVTDVRQYRLDVAALLRQSINGRRERGLADVAQNDVGRRLTGELPRQRRTKRPAGTGDDDHAPWLRHTSRYPPPTFSTIPVTNADASDARNW